MTTFLVFAAAAVVCLAVLGAYIRWDYVQDRKDVWDWPEPEPFEPMPTDWQEAYHYSRSGTPPPASRLPEPEPSPVQTALDEADAAIREWDHRPSQFSACAVRVSRVSPTQREVHWQAPGTTRSIRIGGTTRTVITNAGSPVSIVTESDEIHWRAA